MRIIHLSDLHLGKKVNGFSMLEDQRYILEQIIEIIDRESVECVIIAGDLYDKSMPSAEAVSLCDDFLTKLSERQLYVCVVSGNHDSPERIAFGAKLMENSRLYMSPVYDGTIKCVRLVDEYGGLNFYLMPFVKPVHVRRFFDSEQIDSYTTAFGTIIDNIKMNSNERNIAVVHQFITGALKCDSEDITVGTLDNVDASVFNDFDYVALGHIHRPQDIEAGRIRYCGTPLKYSFSEANDNKSVTIIDIKEKNDVSVTTISLEPMHDMREIEGKFNEITSMEYYKNTNCEDYLHVTLTDEEDVPEALGRLRDIYPNIMTLDYNNTRTRENRIISDIDYKQKKPIEYLSEFYEIQNNSEMDEEQIEYAESIIRKIWGEH